MSSSRNATLAAGLLAAAAAVAALSRLHPRNFAGEVVLIGGGSRGLGLAMAERFARAGAKLVLAARNPAELEQARTTLVERRAVSSADDVLLVPTDLTNPVEVQALVDAALHRFGRIDVLINNAAIIEIGPFEDQTLEAFERAMHINFFGALQTIQAALPDMLRRFRDRGERSSIVNISSIGGKFGVPHLLPYVAAKFALTGFSEGLHAELRAKGVRVTTVCPGLMRTGSVGQAQFTGQAEEEYKWFAFSGTTPGVATSVEHAANRVFRATRLGTAEIVITPQAWLGARANGIAPGLTAFVSSLANEYLLPEPSGNQTLHLGKEVRTSVTDRTRDLERQNNQLHPAR